MDELAKLVETFKADQLITIALEDGGVFTVQKALLCHTSPYFVGALNAHFREAEAKQLRLPGCSTETFELLLYWICTSKLPDTLNLPKDKPDIVHVEVRNESSDHLQLKLVHLWVLADLLLMRRLQDAVIRLFDDISDDFYIAAATVKEVLAVSTTDSLLGRFLLQTFCCDYTSKPGLYSDAQLDDLQSAPGFLRAFAKKVVAAGLRHKIRPPAVERYLLEDDE